MQCKLLWIVVLIGLLSFQGSGVACAKNVDTLVLDYSQATFLSDYEHLTAQQSFYVMLELQMRPGWHSYWQNAGDSGLAPTIILTLPQGATHSDILWQPPQRIAIGPLVNYGYTDKAYYLIKISPPAQGFTGEEVDISATARWLVCDVECIPQKGTFTISLPLARQALAGSDYAKIETLKTTAQLPHVKVHFIKRQQQLYATALFTDFVNEFPNTLENITNVYLYSAVPGLIEPAAPQSWQYDTHSQLLSLVLKPGILPLTPPLLGIIEFTTATEKLYASFTGDITPLSSQLPQETPLLSWPVLLFFAFLGGIILNAMPCVFPVLSLKILALSRQQSMSFYTRALQGLSYTAGVIISFLAIGGLLIGMKTAGATIGWGYHLQIPWVIVVLTYLFFLIGLNLLGYFKINIHLTIHTDGNSQSHTVKHHMLTGLLATLVATPCTAPYMATALGVALIHPTGIDLLVFIALGLGLAFPYLLLTLLPHAGRLLPKPGIWMQHFQQFLAFPMFLTVIWLLWVMQQQTGTMAIIDTLIGMVGLSLIIWLWQSLSQYPRKWFKILLFLLATGMILIPFYQRSDHPDKPHTENNITLFSDDATPYSPEKLTALRQKNQPVFIYASAAWCITCQLNEHIALRSRKVQEAFTRQHITVLKADWTDADPVVTAFLESHQRNGVPLYVFYPKGASSPEILPQLLTPDIVIDAIRSNQGN